MGNTDLKPERGTGWDLGLRAGWGRDTHLPNVAGEVVYYDRRAQDLIQFIQHSQGVSRAVNLGRARIRGVEISLQGSAADLFKLTANYTYQRAVDRSDVPHWRNRTLPNRPQHEGQIRAECGPDRIKTAYVLAFPGGSFLDRANLRPLHSRVVHNVGVEFGLFRSTRLSFEVKNLTGNQVEDVWGYPLPGRGFFVGATSQF